MPTNPGPSPAEVVAALQRGGIVEALKLVLAAKGASSSGRRGTTGPAAHRVEPFKPVARQSAGSDLSPGEVPRSNVDTWLVVLLIAALCVGYYIFVR